MEKIVIIEDDKAIREGLKFYLEQENFEVLEFSNALKFLEEIKNNKDINLILLDINLPDINGFDLFKKIKKINDIPVIFLTADDLETSIVKGLDLGADDYITKPFKARELLSRIRKSLRKNSKNSNGTIKIKNIIIDVNLGKVMKNGKDLFLTSLEYKILLILALNPNIVFSREKILADIWDVNEDYVNDNTLSVYIKRIREKIEDDIDNPSVIVTVRGMGYKIGENNE